MLLIAGVKTIICHRNVWLRLGLLALVCFSGPPSNCMDAYELLKEVETLRSQHAKSQLQAVTLSGTVTTLTIRSRPSTPKSRH